MTNIQPTNNAVQMFRKGWPGEPVNRGVHVSEGELFKRIIDAEVAKSEAEYMQRLAGPLQWQTLEEPILLEKSRQAGRPEAMTITAWCGKTGLNRRQLSQWPIEKVIAFAEQAARNDAEQGICEPQAQQMF